MVRHLPSLWGHGTGAKDYCKRSDEECLGDACSLREGLTIFAAEVDRDTLSPDLAEHSLSSGVVDWMRLDHMGSDCEGNRRTCFVLFKEFLSKHLKLSAACFLQEDSILLAAMTTKLWVQ